MHAILPAVLSCQGTRLSDEEKRFFATVNPLGINLFSRNIVSQSQLKKLIKEIKETIGRNDIIIAVDQEGGRVRRLVEPEYRSYAAAIELGTLPIEEAIQTCQMHSRLISADFQELGINTNYAPVLDVATEQTAPVLLSRCFSDSPQTVSTLGKTCVDEYINNGIVPCIKHIPGHGRTTTDPHLGLPRLDNPLSELENDFMPFRVCHNTPMAMTAHVVISAIDDTQPITQSAQGIEQIIRGLIGFDGLLISDAIEMRALKGTIGDKSARSLAAGCDCICYAFGHLADMQEIAQNCPPMTDSALLRLEKLKKVWNKKVLFANIDKTAQNYQKKIGQIEPYQETYDATEVLNKLMKEKTEC